MIAGDPGKVFLILKKNSYEGMVLLCFWTVDIKGLVLICRIPGTILQPQGEPGDGNSSPQKMAEQRQERAWVFDTIASY